MPQKSDARPAIQDLIDAIRGVFKKYTRATREKSWKGIESSDGKEAIRKLIKDPKIPIPGTAKFLKFKEWLNES